MPRLYAATFSGQAETAQVDFWSLLPAVDKPVEIHYVSITQLLEIGDAAEEQLLVIVKTGNTTVGSGGNAEAGTPIRSLNDVADAAIVRSMDTTKATAGTVRIHAEEHMNVRTGFYYYPVPEDRPMIENNEHFVVELATTPLDSITFAGTIWYAELI